MQQLKLQLDAARTHWKSFPFPALSQEKLEKLQAFIDLLERWTERVDLVAPAPQPELIKRHIIDCVFPGIVTERSPDPLSWLDIGSGAGLPGLVLALLFPEDQVILCEPREQRAIFLEEVCRRLAVCNVECRCERAENLPGEQQFNRTICRALGARKVFLRESARLLVPGGEAIEMGGPNTTSGNSAEGLTYQRTTDYSLPSGELRKLVVWRKLP